MCVHCGTPACQGCHPQIGYYHFTPTARAGWECPKCNTVNAPHVDQCPCSTGSLSPTVIGGVSISPSTEGLSP